MQNDFLKPRYAGNGIGNSVSPSNPASLIGTPKRDLQHVVRLLSDSVCEAKTFKNF